MLNNSKKERIARLQNIAKVKKEDAYESVEALAEYSPSQVKIFIPNSPIKKLKDGIDAELYSASYTEESLGKTSNESDAERSLRRTKKAIIDYALCNEFTLFVTFTFGTDRSNIKRCQRRMKNWIKNECIRKGNFGYIAVSEFHKNHEAIHFHALLTNYPGEMIPSFKASGKPVLKRGEQVYEFPSFTHGFTRVEKIKDGVDDRRRSAAYLAKYITKDMPTSANKNRYWVSHGLKKPVIEYNPEKWYDVVKPDWDSYTSENGGSEHGRILIFNRGSHPLVDMYIEERYHEAE